MEKKDSLLPRYSSVLPRKDRLYFSCYSYKIFRMIYGLTSISGWKDIKASPGDRISIVFEHEYKINLTVIVEVGM